MSRFHTLQVSAVQGETREAISVVFAVPPELTETYRYVQGQHLTLRASIGGEMVRRSYSISSAVQDDALRVTIKRVQDGLFSNWANDELQPGMPLEVMPPSGQFHVPLSPANEKHYVAFAAGAGITPILSIIKTTLRAEPKSRFTLFYGNRASSSVIFREELQELKDAHLSRFRLIFVLSREQQEIDLLNGRLDRAKVDALLKCWVDPDDVDEVFVCGPQSMMDDTIAALLANSVPKSKIKQELFATSLPLTRLRTRSQKPSTKGQCEVTIVLDGRTHKLTIPKNENTVLEAALREGVELPYSCKGGICATCRCKLTTGEVDMDANFALEDYEIRRGFILACQSYPVTDELGINFDEEI
ncbi:phenylacetate-CoA oxygenase/reductase subunit PaaK [Pendulispora rubella]|uniref:Phenylacetate-CoA oxygenase/reductase subunit PaaK n=1 Tax=Pendulispora rubella TaxID=2741070 RepID=A0ABZ2LAQ8_9BACT